MLLDVLPQAQMWRQGLFSSPPQCWVARSREVRPSPRNQVSWNDKLRRQGKPRLKGKFPKGKEIRATVDGDQVQIIEDEDENRQQHWEEVLPCEDQANHGNVSEFQDQAMVYDYNLEQVDFYETFTASWFSDTASIHAILAQERADDAGDGKPIAASSSQPQQSQAQSLPTRQRILPRARAIRGAATKLEESILIYIVSQGREQANTKHNYFSDMSFLDIPDEPLVDPGSDGEYPTIVYMEDFCGFAVGLQGIVLTLLLLRFHYSQK